MTVPVGLMLCDVVSEARNDCSNEYSPFFGGLGVIGNCCKELNSHLRSHGSEEFCYESQSIMGQMVCQHTVQDDPVVDEYGRGARPCYCGDQCGSRYLFILVGQDHYVLIAGFRLLLTDPACAFTGNLVVQQLGTGVAPSDERFAYLPLGKIGSQLMCCTCHWPYKASSSRVSEYR